MTIPGKVQSYMAVGKPIIGAINGSCANFIIDNGIGFTCSSEDSEVFASVISSLPNAHLANIGKRAKEIYLNKYSKYKFFDMLVKQLQNL